MALFAKIFKNAIKINYRIVNSRRRLVKQQEHTLRKLLWSAARTKFGSHYQFEDILQEPDLIKGFQETVPIFDYDKIYNEWWHLLHNGERDVTWPGKIKNFALSSGTTGSASKQIPISRDMLLSIKKASFRQMSILRDFDLPKDFYDKEMLMLGGSTHLEHDESGNKGDLSGIITGNLPVWMNKYYKPGSEISKEKDWLRKIELITKEAHKWDIGIVAGVPAWVQMLFESIIDHYNLKSIHDIWPNFKIYVHGGVAFSPYKERFEKLLGKKLIYLETYLASEGFIAFEKSNLSGSMSLVMNNGIFYEFIPFNSENFNSDGELRETAKAIGLERVHENEEYAIVISTNTGSWRYIIGDTVMFTNLENLELIITGRIKHFLSLCGEHLSVGNMNDAIAKVSEELNVEVSEFTVAGLSYENGFCHKWWIGTDEDIDKDLLRSKLDSYLCELNDDYKTERTAALKEIIVHTIPNQLFLDWLKKNNKIGGSNKFPRVFSKTQLIEWNQFLKDNNLEL